MAERGGAIRDKAMRKWIHPINGGEEWIQLWREKGGVWVEFVLGLGE